MCVGGGGGGLDSGVKVAGAEPGWRPAGGGQQAQAGEGREDRRTFVSSIASTSDLVLDTRLSNTARLLSTPSQDGSTHSSKRWPAAESGRPIAPATNSATDSATARWHRPSPAAVSSSDPSAPHLLTTVFVPLR